MQAPIEISVIIPAFQEEQRIGHTIRELSTYLESGYAKSEIILVLDGCTDDTLKNAMANKTGRNCALTVINLPANRGKGNAVREGFLEASGKYLFFTDADLSFAPVLIEPFLKQLQAGADIVIAQREKTTTYSNPIRRVIAALTRAVIGNLLVPGIRDTQAGFKGFKAACAKSLFASLKTRRYLFDLEILMAARRKGYRIEKIYVDWCDQPGSKVCIGRDILPALFEFLLICLREVREFLVSS